MEIEDKTVKAVKLEGGKTIPTDKCVIAMGPWLVSVAILPDMHVSGTVPTIKAFSS